MIKIRKNTHGRVGLGYLKKGMLLLAAVSGLSLLAAGRVQAEDEAGGIVIPVASEQPPQGPQVTVTFDGNGNGQEPYTKTFPVGEAEEFEIPEYCGYQFMGWNTAADGSGDIYVTGYLLTQDTTLYATWKAYPEGELNVENKALYVGERLQLKLKKATSDVAWSSSDKTVAGVTKDGLVYARKSGKAVITAKQYDKEYACEIKVVVPSDKKAYGIFLSNLKNRENTSFYLSNMDSKGMYEMITVDALPMSITGNASQGPAGYFDEGKKVTTKTVSIYTCKNGRVRLMKRYQLKNGLYLYASRYTKSRMRIANMSMRSTKHIIFSCHGGKISTQVLDSYRGNEYKVVSVYRASKANIKKIFGYEAS